MRGPIIICFLITAALAGLPPLNAETLGRSPFKPDSFVILPAAKVPALLSQCSRPSRNRVNGTWMPTMEQISDLESSLYALLSKSLNSLEWATEKPLPKDYYRQYAGIVVGKRQIIYVNGIHKSGIDEEKLPWQNTPIDICDGGAFYFGAEYDPASKTFLDFFFNGNA